MLIANYWFPSNTQGNSVQVLSNFVHILSQLLGAQLPKKAIRVQTAFSQFPPVCRFLIGLRTLLFYHCRVVFLHLIFLAFYTLEIRIKHWIVIGALTVNPSSTLITQNPLFTIVARVKVYLLTVKTIRLFLVLHCTIVA